MMLHATSLYVAMGGEPPGDDEVFCVFLVHDFSMLRTLFLNM